MSKEKNQGFKETNLKTSLWSKFTKWAVSTFICCGKDIQNNIHKHLEKAGKDILAPAIEKGADLLENIVEAQTPNFGGKVLASAIDNAEDVIVEMLGGVPSENNAAS